MTLKNHLNICLVFFCLMLVFSCTTSKKKYIVGVSQCSDDEWRQQMNREIQTEAWFYDEVDVEFRIVKDNTLEQEEDIRYFMDKGVDLLIVSPNEAAPLTTIIEQVYDAGIPVMVVDRKILSDKYTAYIAGDNYEVGKEVGGYIANMLQGSGNVVSISGLKSSTPAIERHQGLMSILKQFPDINLLCNEDAGWLKTNAYEVMLSILDSFSDIDVVFAQNDRMAAGAYQAALERGRVEDIQFLGIDALPGVGYGIDQVLQGRLDATFIYPTGGDQVMQLAMRILKGEDFPRETILNTAVIDYTNARVVDLQTKQISQLDSKIERLNDQAVFYLERSSTQRIILLGSLIVILLVVVLLIVVLNSLKSKSKLNNELSLKNEELLNHRNQLLLLSEQLEEATNAKLMFFTNISHEFRTPLTLVVDPISVLLEEGELSTKQEKLLALAKKNSTILVRLVNQILDFREYENNQLGFNPQSINIENAFNEWNDSFDIASKRKNINFSFLVEENTYPFIADVDLEKLERIYFNLLSNALKFTPEKGCIVVSLSHACFNGIDGFQLKVKNSGSLISKEHVKSIFNRFYKIDSNYAGSGIGLALVKAFVDMHGGAVSVSSEEGEGTEFVVFLPNSQNLVGVASLAKSSEGSIFEEAFDRVERTDDKVVNEREQLFRTYDEDKESILLIEDNADIRSYLYEILSEDYTLIEAENGENGIQLAKHFVPDLIISDVMMPGIDGFECCRILKSEIQTSHIPIILLTACSLDEQRIKGYEGGADSYISKPFSSKLLVSRVKNLLEARKQMKKALSENEIFINDSVGDIDRQFIQSFNDLLAKHMSDSTLSVEDIGVEMGMSRVQLYRKIKSLTNYAPNELLRLYRLQKAKQLMHIPNKSVADIAYEVGFSSPSYFSKCYKDQYGETPSEAISRKR